jgi:NtrC-family two-component system response regulator AlgB
MAEIGAPAPSVLVIDDDKNIRGTLTLCLEDMGCVVVTASNGTSALAALDRRPFDLALLDLQLGVEHGIALLPRLLVARPGLAVIIITAQAAIETAVEAIKLGAVDYLPKPFTPAQIRHVVGKIAAPRLGGAFTLDQIEREHIERVVAHTAKLDDAAAILGIDTSTLYRKRKRWET